MHVHLGWVAIAAALSCLVAGAGCGDDDDATGGDGDADSDTDADSDADTDADTDGDADDCVTPDRVCPAEHPQPGGPCDVQGDCPYDADEPDARWVYRCVDGAWEAAYECSMPGCSAVPPLAELCLDPFQGTMDAATLALGPAMVTEPFRPFEDGDDIDVVWGPQGGAMIPYRVRISGTERSPACVGLTASLEVDGQSGDPFVSRLALHCGTSLAVYAIFPFPEQLCAMNETITATLHAEVAGVGEASAPIEFVSEGCPRNL